MCICCRLLSYVAATDRSLMFRLFKSGCDRTFLDRSLLGYDTVEPQIHVSTDISVSIFASTLKMKASVSSEKVGKHNDGHYPLNQIFVLIYCSPAQYITQSRSSNPGTDKHAHFSVSSTWVLGPTHLSIQYVPAALLTR
jgi:hypothetical protein